MGVRIEPIVRRDLSRKVRTVGRIAYDERRVDHVHTKVQGWIERLFVEYEGESVRRGQPLLEIYSPALVSTQEELLLAARYRDSTRESRFEDVSRGGEDLFLATRRRLELWDISKHDINRLLDTGEVRKNLTLYAPTEGVELVPHATSFRYRDPRYEDLTPAQKQFLRMGPRNVKIIQGKLREIAAALAALAAPAETE